MNFDPFVLIAAFCLSGFIPVTASGLHDDFEAAAPGPLTASWLEKYWKVKHPEQGLDQQRVTVVKEQKGDAGTVNTFIRVLYPSGQTNSAHSGASWRAPLPATDEATAEYRVRVEPGFDWTRGGKLPGLAGGSGATGGRPSPDGFSARYMWHPEGGLILYLYHSGQKGRYGDGLRLGRAGTLRPDQWHTLRQRIRLNTPGEPDGILQVWVDGRLALDRHDMRWRLAGHAWQIDHFYFSTFHGGSGTAYQPQRDNHADFDDFSVTVLPRQTPTYSSPPPPLSLSLFLFSLKTPLYVLIYEYTNPVSLPALACPDPGAGNSLSQA
ncbi:MAG: polysaccharide lyase [Opitutaceae bacterium]|jgi:hypothetical protein|nr:polysaccharide lyase [Opitutaceae bacterium]